jgi:hypothetical protein
LNRSINSSSMSTAFGLDARHGGATAAARLTGVCDLEG